MKIIIIDLWIVTKSGIVVFSRISEQRIRVQLLGAFLSVLNSLAEGFSESALTYFELSSTRYTIFKRNNFLFVAHSFKEIEENLIKEELKKISDKFFQKYSKIFNKWDNDISFFSGFEKDLEKLFIF